MHHNVLSFTSARLGDVPVVDFSECWKTAACGLAAESAEMEAMVYASSAARIMSVAGKPRWDRSRLIGRHPHSIQYMEVQLRSHQPPWDATANADADRH